MSSAINNKNFWKRCLTLTKKKKLRENKKLSTKMCFSLYTYSKFSERFILCQRQQNNSNVILGKRARLRTEKETPQIRILSTRAAIENV